MFIPRNFVLSSAHRLSMHFLPHLRRRNMMSSLASRIQWNQTMRLPDGRTLGFAEYGSSNGVPLFFFHGFPSSRLEMALLDGKLKQRNIRVIAPDRPGFGLSSPQPGRRITDWPSDVQILAKHLAIPRFAVLGGSGGGPYALACAHALPRDSLLAVGVLAGAPPWEEASGVPLPATYTRMSLSRRVLAKFANYAPGTLRVICDRVIAVGAWIVNSRPVTKRIDAWIDAQEKASERKEVMKSSSSLTTEERRELIVRPMFEAFAQGSGPMVEETRLLIRDWGFRFEDITYDKIFVWHGVKDANSPISRIRYMADRIPHARLTEYDDTHYTVGRHLDEIFTDLLPDCVDKDPPDL